MSEQPPKVNPEAEPKKEKAMEGGKFSASFTRHSKAGYRTYGEAVVSDNPLKGLNPNEQLIPDLPEVGIELAKEKAEQFFAGLDPEKDVLFFLSSDQARALETADIYRQVAHQKGFEVLKPENVRSEITEKIGEGEIRKMFTLSLDHSGGALFDSVFNGSKKPEVNWGAVDPKIKARYDQAAALVDADDQGGFGANLHKHGEAVQRILPEIETAKNLYDREFKNLMRLAKFGSEKAEEAGLEKRVKVLAFGHENYMMEALSKYFDENGINNCETVNFEVEEGKITGEFRGKESSIE